MASSVRHGSYKEHRRINVLRKGGVSLLQIAKCLGLSEPTICREVARNCGGPRQRARGQLGDRHDHRGHGHEGVIASAVERIFKYTFLHAVANKTSALATTALVVVSRYFRVFAHDYPRQR